MGQRAVDNTVATISIDDTADHAWGLTPHPRTRAHHAATITTHLGRALLFFLAVVIGGGGVILSNTQPAHAEVDLTCDSFAMRLPDPSRAGDGPESIMPARNLAGIKDGESKDHRYLNFSTVQSQTALDTMNLYEVVGLRVTYLNSSYKPQDLVNDGVYTATAALEGMRDCSMTGWLWTNLANIVLNIKSLVLQGIISLKDASFDPNPLDWAFEGVASPINSIVTNFIFPMFAVLLVIAGINIAINAVRADGLRRALGGVLGTCGALMLVAVVFGGSASTFTMVRDLADEAITSVGNGIAEGLLSGAGSGEQGMNCYTPPPESGDNSQTGQRIANCVLADTLVYQPWIIGQYGAGMTTGYWLTSGTANITQPSTVRADFDSYTRVQTSNWGTQGTFDNAHLNSNMQRDAGEDRQGNTARYIPFPCYIAWRGCHNLPAAVLVQQSGPTSVGGGTSVAAAKEDCRSTAVPIGRDVDSEVGTGPFARELSPIVASCDPFWASYWALGRGDSATAFHGGASMNRLSQEVISLIGVAVVGVAVAIMCVLVLIWHARIFALFLIGPLQLLASAAPGKGHMTRDWLTSIGHAWLNRVAYSVGVTIVILMVTLVFQQSLSTMMKLVWLGIILFAFFKLITKVQASLAVSSPTMAGGGGAGDVQGVTGAAQTAAGVAVDAGQRGVAAGQGGYAGGVAAYRRRRGMQEGRAALADEAASAPPPKATPKPSRKGIPDPTTPLGRKTAAARGKAAAAVKSGGDAVAGAAKSAGQKVANSKAATAVKGAVAPVGKVAGAAAEKVANAGKAAADVGRNVADAGRQVGGGIAVNATKKAAQGAATGAATAAIVAAGTARGAVDGAIHKDVRRRKRQDSSAGQGLYSSTASGERARDAQDAAGRKKKSESEETRKRTEYTQDLPRRARKPAPEPTGGKE